MTIEKLRGWLEVIGIFGVIASLVFVGVQIKQDQEIARAGMYQARSEMLSQAMASAAANTEAIAVLAKASYGDADREVMLEGLASSLTAYEYLLGLFQARSISALTDNSFIRRIIGENSEGDTASDHSDVFVVRNRGIRRILVGNFVPGIRWRY